MADTEFYYVPKSDGSKAIVKDKNARDRLDIVESEISTITGSSVIGVKGDAESTYRAGNVNITPTNIGLGNVDNTSDADKPISTATQTALNAKVNTSDISAANTPYSNSNSGLGATNVQTAIDEVVNMIFNNHFTAGIEDEAENVITDESGNLILGDFKFQIA